MSDTAREFDVVVFGATGFAGELTARYLAEHAPPGTRIALAGRSQAKLEQIRAQLPPSAKDWPLIVADSDSPASLDAMAARTRVVATTVGPYLKYGEALISAVANAGTDYVDLTGEVPFVRWSIDKYDELAASTGARIVHACGYDSIPSDLGVHELHRQVQADEAGTLGETTMVVASFRGGVSGGTVDSMRVITELARDKEQRRLLMNPHALSSGPGDVPRGGRDSAPSDNQIGKASDVDPSLRGSIAPFVMASYNTRIVRRSHYLMGEAYGPGFRYAEAMRVGKNAITSRIAAAGVAAGIGALFAGMSMKPTRRVLDRFLPKPGEGPSEEARENGYFTHKTFTTTSTGARYVATVAAQGDPGYKATAMMLGEAALTLALDRDKLPDRHGVLTPASAMGEALTDRLRAAGMTIKAERIN
ncbi:MAG TPA: saccharopine dehydrogenase NADP-binding domain-containing protein [Aeromicrobium sp.]|nr:saccharopine dehydrogenase NADP-binding domain-containing protein [Aeromicrobium sp.]HKY57488.1 saccharopine dehydrogenase NADP-binding domain-containing protein [Aeromicrobium sp.]